MAKYFPTIIGLTCKNMVFGILMLISTGVFGQKNPEQAELARFEAMMKKDTTALRQWLSGDLQYVHSNGLSENYSEHLRNVGSGKIVYQRMARQTFRLHRQGKTAIITGRLAVGGTFEGKDFSVLLQYTAVYRKTKGHWKLWHWQSTKVG